MDRVLILGASGLVGNALLEELSPEYDVYGTYHSRAIDLPPGSVFRLDVNDIGTTKEILEQVSPRIVISCLQGDYTGQLNTHNYVAEYLKQKDGRMYFCSTANVFDNDVTRPHYEEDKPNAKSDYGKFKVQCETMLGEILGQDSVILRLPMIWGKDSSRLTDLLVKLENNEEIKAYANLYLNNSTDVMIAKQVHCIIKNDLRGIFHLGTDDITTHLGFVMELIRRLGYENPRIKMEILPTEKHYLAILSKRTELPNKFRLLNDDILEYLR